MRSLALAALLGLSTSFHGADATPPAAVIAAAPALEATDAATATGAASATDAAAAADPATAAATATAVAIKGDATGTIIMHLHGDYALRQSGGMFGAPEASLFEFSQQLRAALRAKQNRLVLDMSQGFAPGLATAEELAALIRDNKGSKTVACLLDGCDDRALVVAAACDEVVVAQAGLLDVKGLDLSMLYFADLLGKLGIHFHAVTSGAHKTAPETFTRNGPSDAAVEEYRGLGQTLDADLIALSTRPGLDAAGLLAARAQAPQVPQVAVATHLADAAVEPGEWLAAQPKPVTEWKDRHRDVPDLQSFAGMMAFWGQLLKGDDGDRPDKEIAVVELAGEIDEGLNSEPGRSIAPGDTCALLDKLSKDDRVVAVVLRIDSPGGSAGAADRIHHAVRRLDAVKPVVALFDGVAASGGYYIGCAAREIIVHRSTITGSIGVFAVVPDASATLDLLGVHRFAVPTGPRADLLGMGPYTPDTEAALRAVVDDVDHRFTNLVADRRKLPVAKVAAMAGGRVYTGSEAVANGLADSIGTFAIAAVHARRLAGVGSPLPLERLPHDRGILDRLGIGPTEDDSLAPIPAAMAGLVPVRLQMWLRVAHAQQPVIMAWCQF
jgi:protease-4